MIYRDENRGFFTRLSNEVLRMPVMTLNELGLYAVMLSRPDNWEFSDYVLSKQLGISTGEVQILLRGLERKGYVRQRMGRNGAVWDLYEKPAQKTAPLKPEQTDPEPAQIRTEPTPETTAADDPDESGWTREQIAQGLFEQAEKLRQQALRRKIEKER